MTVPTLPGVAAGEQKHGICTTRWFASAALLFLALAPDAIAQAGTSGAVARAQSLVAAGDAGAARALLDSVLADMHPDQAVYGDALYWRGALSTNPEEARKDMLRLLVDYPFSPLVPEALFRLSQADIASGDRRGAIRHLERLVRDHSSSIPGPAAAFQLGQLLMDNGDYQRACPVLDSALAYEARSNVETRNRITYVRRPCEGILAAVRDSLAMARDTTRSARGAGVLPQALPPTMGPGTPRASGRGAATAARWTVQVAAFGGRADATAMAARLSARGYQSRVTDARPYRVRVGRFATHAEATGIAAKLRAEKTTAIVVEAERP